VFINLENQAKGYMKNLEVSIENITEPLSEFHGPMFAGEIFGLKIIVTLSNSSVKIGETLWIKVRLIGEKAYNVKLLRMSIIESWRSKSI